MIHKAWNVDAADAARVLGMKTEEVVAVDGNVVRLHDGTRFEIDVEAGTHRQLLATADVPEATEPPAADAGTVPPAAEGDPPAAGRGRSGRR